MMTFRFSCAKHVKVVISSIDARSHIPPNFMLTSELMGCSKLQNNFPQENCDSPKIACNGPAIVMGRHPRCQFFEGEAVSSWHPWVSWMAPLRRLRTSLQLTRMTDHRQRAISSFC